MIHRQLQLIGYFCWALTTSSSLQADVSIETSIKRELLGLTKMREALADTLGGQKQAATEADFKRVCAPVGNRLQQWAQSEGYHAIQISDRFRNPKHRPSAADQEIVDLFRSDHKPQSVQITYETEVVYYQQIKVIRSCLHCHGPKDSRPEFIVKKYPADLAFDFKVGDLRGAYKVIQPNSGVKKKNSEELF